MTMAIPTRGLHGTQDAALKAFTAAHLPMIEAAVARACKDLLPLAPEHEAALADALDVGGGQAHRWRPLVLLCATDACGGTPAQAVDVGAALELTHTASLVLDDLPCMDDARLRRGRPATHQQVGTAGAILLAVGLLGRAAELIGRAPAGAAMLSRAWGRAVGLAGMSGGQVMDLRVREGQKLTGAARRLYREKTTALAALSAEAGGVLAGAPEACLVALHRYGAALGWAYQLRDDDQDIEEDRVGGLRLLALEQAALRRARLVERAERALMGAPWVRPESAWALAAAARRIGGVPAAALRDRHSAT